MTKDEILAKLKNIFTNLFGDIDFSEDTSVSDIEDWDSLANVKILMMTEKEFNVKIDVAEIHHIVSVKQLTDIIQKCMA